VGRRAARCATWCSACSGAAELPDVPVPDSVQASLRPYQQQGLNWLQFLREHGLAGILADDMGLGKTVQTLAHIQVEKDAGRLTTPALIIAPVSLMGNWRREAARFCPNCAAWCCTAKTAMRWPTALPSTTW
jgi:SNF2 family DNA or RNA helicase